jgi:hypothetical protein
VSEKKPVIRKRTRAVCWRTSYTINRQLLSILWVMRQGKDGPSWSRQRVIERAIEKFAAELGAAFPGGKLPEIPDATLEAL